MEFFVKALTAKYAEYALASPTRRAEIRRRRKFDEGGEKFFGNSFVYFAWFAVKLPRRAREKCEGAEKVEWKIKL